eukprot:gene10699-3320_t
MRDYIVDTFYKLKNKYVDQDIISELLNKYMKGEKYLLGEKKLKFFTFNNYELIYSVLELLIDKKKGPIGTYSFRCGDLTETFLNMRYSIHFTHPTIRKKMSTTPDCYYNLYKKCCEEQIFNTMKLSKILSRHLGIFDTLEDYQRSAIDGYKYMIEYVYTMCNNTK